MLHVIFYPKKYTNAPDVVVNSVLGGASVNEK